MDCVITFNKFLNLLCESAISDQYERDVANNMDAWFSANQLDFLAERPTVDTTYSDIEVTDLNTDYSTFVEVKMNHTDNLYNKRLNVVNGVFVPVTIDEDAVIGDSICDDYLNKNTTILDELSEFLKTYNPRTLIENEYFNNVGITNNLDNAEIKKKINLVSSKKTPLLNKNGDPVVPASIMHKFINNQKTNSGDQYFYKASRIPIRDLLISHYTYGKAEPATYIQTGDDFFKLSSEDRIKFIDPITSKDVPLFPEVIGHLCVGFRKRFGGPGYEIQPELKIDKMDKHSPYSFKPGTNKELPIPVLKK